MNKRPYVILKYAASLDGFLDDCSPARRVFSSSEDLREVEFLRASVDAILIGAQTLRRDNPRLSLRLTELREERMKRGQGGEPLRIILTCSGNISHHANIFTSGGEKPIIYFPSTARDKLRSLASVAHLRELGENKTDLSLLLRDLAERGVQKLLVEGGAKTLESFFQEGNFDEVRHVVSPDLLSSQGYARLELVGSKLNARLSLKRIQNLGGVTLLEYRRANDALG